MRDHDQARSTFPKVDAGELLRKMESLSELGGGDDGSMNRLTLSDADRQGRDWLVQEFQRAGLRLEIDPVGNMFGVLDWAGPDAPLIMCGSHIDSQPNGGRFDGAYGVVAACSALEAVVAKARQQGVQPKVNFAIVNWTNEEGARFQPSLLGSGFNAGVYGLDYVLSRTDGQGVTFAQAIEAIGYSGKSKPIIPDALIEIHIEGSSVLEERGARFGAFTRFWGATKYRLAFLGEQAHTGPTAMADRHDALLGAAYLMAELKAMADRSGVDLYTSVGRLEVLPNSPNVVPAKATLFIELRSADPVLLASAEEELKTAMASAAKRASVGYEVLAVDHRRAGSFDPGLIALAERTAKKWGHDMIPLSTIGGHDAVAMSAVSPAIVLAVPSVGGVIHNPTEYTSPEDRLLGTEILADMLWEFCVNGNVIARKKEAVA